MRCTRQALALVIVIVTLIGCTGGEEATVFVLSASLDQEFVIALEANGERIATGLIAPSDAYGFIHVGERLPPGTRFVILDSATCDILSTSDPLSRAHTSAFVTFDGIVYVGDEDPRRLYDIADLVPATTRCRGAPSN
jgi:hypothetical protein